MLFSSNDSISEATTWLLLHISSFKNMNARVVFDEEILKNKKYRFLVSKKESVFLTY